MPLRSFFLLLLLASPVCSQAIPELPELPSPSPPPSPSPLPSALADIVNAKPTAVPPNGPLPATSVAPAENPVPVPPTAGSPSALPSPSISPTPNFIDENGECERDLTRPRPKLGKNQRRYAIAVLVSAVAVAIASILYNGVNTWKPNEDYSNYRFVGILIARVLIVGSVRISAALVASITKASPNDSALDASGAFLTWGTGVFTRLYYEGIVMTLAAVGLTENEGSWDDALADFLNEKAVQRLQNNEDEYIPDVDTGAGQPDLENGENDNTEGKFSFWHTIFGGKWERKLLLLTAIIYFAAEVALMVSNVLSLVGSLEIKDDRAVFFTPDEEDGQCPFNSRDLSIVFGLVVLQIVFALTYQPSLVPLLRVSGFHNKRVCYGLKWIACLVLLVAVVTLLTLPLLEGALEPLFTAGDISLFWFVFIAPPTYSSVSYIITTAYTILSAVVGSLLLYRISRSPQWSSSKR